MLAIADVNTRCMREPENGFGLAVRCRRRFFFAYSNAEVLSLRRTRMLARAADVVRVSGTATRSTFRDQDSCSGHRYVCHRRCLAIWESALARSRTLGCFTRSPG